MPLPSRVSAPDLIPQHVFYLHGFASSPQSTKVGYFRDHLRQHGIDVQCPDFNQPDFSTLTITRMLDQLGADLARLDGEPATLFGSSLGGTLAVLAADRFGAQIDRLVLMAPAVMFAKPGHHLLPPEKVEEWRRRGTLPVFHHADQAERDLRFAFYEDSLRYDAFHAAVRQPTIIFQGLHDASVDYRTVEAFAKTRGNVTLSLLDDDHQLIASLPRMWTDVRAFLGLDE
ncbi:MAG: esterase YqiA [Acidobacteria bacterium]|nr:esterase YqiA [Acidobacteriota bacterium]